MANFKLISNRKYYKSFFICLFAYLLICLFAKDAFAQTLSLSIHPPLLEVMIQPGKSITQVYKLANGGETDLALTSKVVPFEPGDEQGNIYLLTPEVSRRRNTTSGVVRLTADWFSFQNADLDLGQKFLLKSGEEQEVVLKLKVPQNSFEDDYYTTLLFETIPGVFIGGQSQVQAQAKIGTNILITVSKDGKPLKKAEIVEFRFQVSGFRFQVIDSFDKPSFILRIKNTGKTFFKPQGTITTTGWLGQEYILDLLPENILVNSVRAINCATLGSPDEFGPCRLSPRFLLGPYQAKVEFGLDEETADYRREITFIAIPWKLLLGVLAVIALLFLIQTRTKI